MDPNPLSMDKSSTTLSRIEKELIEPTENTIYSAAPHHPMSALLANNTQSITRDTSSIHKNLNAVFAATPIMGVEFSGQTGLMVPNT